LLMYRCLSLPKISDMSTDLVYSTSLDPKTI
jgi:hypothetical protein